MTVPFPNYPGYGVGPGPSQQYQTFFCQKCGAVVMSMALHEGWHDRLERDLAPFVAAEEG